MATWHMMPRLRCWGSFEQKGSRNPPYSSEPNMIRMLSRTSYPRRPLRHPTDVPGLAEEAEKDAGKGRGNSLAVNFGESVVIATSCCDRRRGTCDLPCKTLCGLRSFFRPE
eukprot:681214-Pyramimonas_sp.AAC.1